MAMIPGVNIPDKITPFDTFDSYATHEDIFGAGGLVAVASLTERDAIPPPRRKVGQVVSVANDAFYVLANGIDNSDFMKVEIFSAKYYTTTEPIDGDIGDPVNLDLTLLVPTDVPRVNDIITSLDNDRSARVTDVDTGLDVVTATIIDTTEHLPVSDYEEDVLYIKDFFVTHNGQLAKIVATFTSADEGDIDDSFEKDIEDGNLALISDSAVNVYKNDDYPTLSSVKDALDKLLYITPVVQINGGGVYEVGDEVTTLNLTWVWNKDIKTQSIDQGVPALDETDRAYTDTVSIQTDTVYTITGSDGVSTVDDSTSFTFRPRRFWGVSEDAILSDADVIALAGSDLEVGRAQTRTFDCSGGVNPKFFYIVYPTTYGEASFKVGGFNYSAAEHETRTLLNQFGENVSYEIYRSGIAQTGSKILVECS